MLVWPVKFMLMILAVNPDGSYNDHAIYPTEFTSIQQCEMDKPKDHLTREGITIVYRCVMQSGA